MSLTFDQQDFRKFIHDIRSELSGVVGYAQILSEQEQKDENKKWIAGILRSANALLGLLDVKKQTITEGASPTKESKVNIGSPASVSPLVSVKEKTVLVIDDEQKNLEILSHFLSQSGFSVLAASNRKESLEALEKMNPDVVLMDVMMPDVSGYDLCEEIKKNPKVEDVPIIFLSGLTDLEDRLRAYDAGGVDYVLKPFYPKEVLVRVHTQISLRDAKRDIEKQAEVLEKRVEEQTRQLIHSDRMASLGLLSANVAHEINNPLTFIKGNISFLNELMKDFLGLFKKISIDSHSRDLADRVSSQLPKMIESMEVGADRIARITSGLRSFARQDAQKKEPMSIQSCLEEALLLTGDRLKRNVEVTKHIPDDLLMVQGNPQQLAQVLMNLIVNAEHAMREKRPGTLNIRAFNKGDFVTLEIEDNGCGMNSETLGKIWTPFFTTKSENEGTGLGLSIVLGIIKEHGGNVEVTSTVGKGTTFSLSFPAAACQIQNSKLKQAA